MTSGVSRSSAPSLNVPLTQNTAPVLEFNCLYTHDIRRKSKRWQDGFLRFHTFNKRIMVYDIPRNFIGDTHWKLEDSLQDGDEVTLEKFGVLVQVADLVGRTETDLSEVKKSARRQNASTGYGQTAPIRPAQPLPNRHEGPAARGPSVPLKHRSLNALLGTPKGPIGKAALPQRSPFEERRERFENSGWEESRPSKQRRLNQPSPRALNHDTSHCQVSRRSKVISGLSAGPLRNEHSFSNYTSNRSTPQSAIDHGRERPQSGAVPSGPIYIGSSSPPSQIALERPQREYAISREHGAIADRAVRSHSRKTQYSEPFNVPESRPAHSSPDPPEAYRPRSSHQGVLVSIDEERQRPSGSPDSDTGATLRLAKSAPRNKTLACLDQLSAGLISAQPKARESRKNERASQKRPRTKGTEPQQRVDIVSGGGEHSAGPTLEPDAIAATAAANSTDLASSKATRTRGPQSLPQAERHSPPAVPYPANPVQSNPTTTTTTTTTTEEKATSAPSTKRDTTAPSTSKHPPLRSRPRTSTPGTAPHSADSLSHSNDQFALAPTKPFHQPKPRARPSPSAPAVVAAATAPDPWSREAFDLFEWRPPGWNEEKWCVEKWAEAEGVR